jgi:hypothetical protein
VAETTQDPLTAAPTTDADVADPLSVMCLAPMCAAAIGEPCHTDSYMPKLRDPHPIRQEVADLVRAAGAETAERIAAAIEAEARNGSYRDPEVAKVVFEVAAQVARGTR